MVQESILLWDLERKGERVKSMESWKQVRFYVGGVGFNPTQIQEADKMALVTFGGYTRFGGWGGWISPKEGVVEELTLVWEVNTTGDIWRARVSDFANYLKEQFKQEAVLVSVGDVLTVMIGGS